VSERLTDEELDVLSRCFPTPRSRRPTAAVLVQRCISELKERRQRDLSEADVKILRGLFTYITENIEPSLAAERSLVILKRLTEDSK
jgi:hypothetical protein